MIVPLTITAIEAFNFAMTLASSFTISIEGAATGVG